MSVEVIRLPRLTPSALPKLSGNEVHLWWLPRSLPDSERGHLFTEDAGGNLLEPHPHLESERSHLKAWARRTRQTLLAHYLEIAVPEVKFTYGQYGKPLIAASPTIDFSTSYTAHGAVIAFSRHGFIGVDAECNLAVASTLGDYAFTPAEIAWARLSADFTRAFTELWTRKEAVLKALGCGLNLSPASFSTVAPGDDPASNHKWNIRWESGERIRGQSLTINDAIQVSVASTADSDDPVHVYSFGYTG